MKEILEKLAPKPFNRVMEAYVQTWLHSGKDNEIAVPLITLYLLQGGIVYGEVIHIDFELGMLTLRDHDIQEALDVYYVDFKSVHTFMLHQLERCTEFVDILRKL